MTATEVTTSSSGPTHEVGSLVRARGREWVVLPESEADLLVLRPLGGGHAETAAVFPHLEPVEAASFGYPAPDDAGDAVAAGLLRSALRVGFQATAGPFRSLGSLSFEPRPYQLVPLLMALRQDPVRLLIADDVGIGKTIEAGLIASELLAQGDANGLAVLCSPALAEQWQAELVEKFGIEAELVLPSTATRLERGLLLNESLFDRYPHVVVSTDFIKSQRRRDDFVRACPDLVIIDEAHTSVTDDTGTGTGTGRMQRYELARRLAADEQRHLILTTATPHSGKEDRFRALLGLLDPELATLDLDQTAARQRLARHFVQRRRGDIRSYLDERTPFPADRETREESYALAEDYRKLLDRVLDYAREVVRDDTGAVRQRVRYWSALALLRALASSPRAAYETLRKRARNADAESRAEADELGRSAVLDTADDEGLEAADATPGADDTAEQEGRSADPHHRRLLDMARQAAALEGPGTDAKLARVTEVVQQLLADGYDPVVFCRFIDTADYVAEHLTAALGRTAAVRSVTGTLPPEERANRVTELAEAGQRRVLVATDCLSEGVNLQQVFQAVVHYDLAWNPTRHEQREGRVDRFGQPSPVVRAVTLYGRDNAVDGVVLNVLIRKHEAIRKRLGIAVPVPDRSDEVVEALVEGMLLRGAQAEQLTLDLDGIAEKARQNLEVEWDSAAERERTSPTRYAQHAIHPQQVADELAEIRASLGTPAEVENLVAESLDALGATRTACDGGFTATTGTLPVGLRDALSPTRKDPLPFHRDLPVPRREAHLDRTDPDVAAIARYVLDTALDESTPAWRRPARRAGAMRTDQVSRRTALLLVRFRMHLTLPGRHGTRRVVAEDAKVLAVQGRGENRRWLDDAEVAELLTARPSGNIPPDQARDFLSQAVEALPALAPDLDTTADQLATRLRESHLRVREAARQQVRSKIAVAAHKPPDVLGVYVYLPETSGGGA